MSELSLCELDHFFRSSLHLKQTRFTLVTWPLPSRQNPLGASTLPSSVKLLNILFLLSLRFFILTYVHILAHNYPKVKRQNGHLDEQ
jgi:hypothetical protein